MYEPLKTTKFFKSLKNKKETLEEKTKSSNKDLPTIFPTKINLKKQSDNDLNYARLSTNLNNLNNFSLGINTNSPKIEVESGGEPLTRNSSTKNILGTNLSRRGFSGLISNHPSQTELWKKKNLRDLVMEKHMVVSMELINLNDKDEEGRNIVHRACLQQKIEIIKNLSTKLGEVEVEMKDRYGNTPLLLACKEFKFQKENQIRREILKILLSKKARVNIVGKSNGWAPVHWLCFNGDKDSLTLLIDAGAVYFLPDKKGYYPIDLAGIRGYRMIVELIIIELIEFLDVIGDYHILDPKILQIEKNITLNSEDSSEMADKNHEEFDPDNIYNQYKDTNQQEEAKMHRNLILQSPKRDQKNGEPTSERKKIKTNLEILNPVLQTLFVKVMINHCLYWVCYFKLNNMYVNKLTELGAKGNVN
jgi:ankyrin repeat protein